jgi:hypothetical protein
VHLGERPQLVDYEGELATVVAEFGFAVDSTASRLREPVPAEVLAAIDVIDPLGVRNLEDKDHRSAVLARISNRGGAPR